MKLGRAFIVIILFLAAPLGATIFGTVRGTVTDAKRTGIPGVAVRLSSRTSGWQATATTDAAGAFAFQAVPIGSYVVAAGDSAAIEVASGAIVTVNLKMVTVAASVDVTAAATPVDPRSPATQNTISRIDVQQSPGADRANSLSMITDFVPSAVIVHDQLHVRGGHQVDWLIDGIPVPNTNIASNVGPQFDPRDVDTLETQRGGYSAEYGDRTYAVFNVVPRSGFERANEAQVLLNYGSHRSTDDQINFGSHADRFAYYASASVNRTDAGLETPEPTIVHDAARGTGGFVSLIFLPTDSDQLRLVGSARADRYEVPDSQDLEREHDAFLNTTWLRTVSSSALLTVAPFFHVNAAHYDGSEVQDQRTSRYAGAEATYAITSRGNDLRAGAFGFHQQDDARLSVESLSQSDAPSGSVAAVFIEDRYDVTDRLTVRGGVRFTRFSGGVHETATTPRAGVTFRAGAHAILRASYSDVYQAPPLSTATGPLLEFAAEQGFGFLPLHGERDRQAEIGLSVPVAAWNFDVAAFRTNARNFFDHDVLGNSNVFFPLTIDRVFIRGAELMAQSPLVAGRVRVHVAFSHQTVEGDSGVTGGLTDFSPPEEGRFFLDHDQRNTLSAGASAQLPRGAWVSGNLAYGSGFLQGNGPQHLPGHATLDLASALPLGRWTLKLTATNVTNKRYELDESNTFGGTHWNDPRVAMAQVEYRFHY